jgi:anti-sigma factor RsiW
MTETHGWGLSEQHLALDALVAFVDGELSPGARDRAAAHIARCSGCAADAAAQRQARAEVRTAQAPAMSPRLLRALQSIPSEADIPGQPDELALTPDGQLVTVERRARSVPPLGMGAPLGSSTPLGRGRRLFSESPGAAQTDTHRHGAGRRTRQGAGVVFSGLVLGALALMNLPTDREQEPPAPLPQLPGGHNLPAAVPSSVRQAAPTVPVRQRSTGAVPTPVRSTPPAVPADTPTLPSDTMDRDVP